MSIHGVVPTCVHIETMEKKTKVIKRQELLRELSESYEQEIAEIGNEEHADVKRLRERLLDNRNEINSIYHIIKKLDAILYQDFCDDNIRMKNELLRARVHCTEKKECDALDVSIGKLEDAMNEYWDRHDSEQQDELHERLRFMTLHTSPSTSPRNMHRHMNNPYMLNDHAVLW